MLVIVPHCTGKLCTQLHHKQEVRKDLEERSFFIVHLCFLFQFLPKCWPTCRFVQNFSDCSCFGWRQWIILSSLPKTKHQFVKGTLHYPLKTPTLWLTGQKTCQEQRIIIYKPIIGLTRRICEQIRFSLRNNANSMTARPTHSAAMSRKSSKSSATSGDILSRKLTTDPVGASGLRLFVFLSWANVSVDAHSPPRAGCWSLPLRITSSINFTVGGTHSHFARACCLELERNGKNMMHPPPSSHSALPPPPFASIPSNPWRLHSPGATCDMIGPRLCSILKLASWR